MYAFLGISPQSSQLEQMLRRICIASLSPPCVDLMERVTAIADINQRAALSDPGNNGCVYVRCIGFHIFIAQYETLVILQISGKTTHVVQLNRMDRQTVFYKGHCHAEEVRECCALNKVVHQGILFPDLLHQPGSCFFIHGITGVFVHCSSETVAQLFAVHDTVREGSLEQSAVGHKYAYPVCTSLKEDIALLHVTEKLEHAGQQRGIALRDRLGLVGLEACFNLFCNSGLESWVASVKYAVRPRADLIMPDMRMQQGCHCGSSVVVFVILPGIGGKVFDGVI